MNIPFTTRRKPDSSVPGRTYQVIVVPFDVGRNGEAKKVDVEVWIDNRLCQLNYDLAWTWFLPNPLWSPKDRK
jgi:hypothetical protein